MRVRTIEPRDNSAPFNAVYDGFGAQFFAELFEGRRRIEQFDQEYVPNRDSEKELIGFTKARTKDICLFVGPPGIGKTTLIRYLESNVWNTQHLATGSPSVKQCKVLYKDCSKHVLDLPREVYQDTDSRENAASTIANELLRDHLKKHAFELRATSTNKTVQESSRLSQSDWQELFEFISALDEESDIAVPDAYLLPAPDYNEAARELMSREGGMLFAKVLFCYYVYRAGYDHVKIVFDNLDDKNSAVIESLIENTAHAVKFMSNIRLSKNDVGFDSRIAYSVIVACRPATAIILKGNNNHPGHKWYQTKEVSMTHAASLTQILSKRFRVLSNVYKDVPVGVTAGLGVWEFPSRTDFFVALCNSLEESGQGEEFVELANRSIADAVSFVGEVLRNRHFVDVTKVIADYFGRSSGTVPPSLDAYKQSGRNAINRTTVVRSLAYGNQGDSSKPVYPGRGTPISNLLESKPHSLFSQSIAKPRIIQRLIRRLFSGGTSEIDATTYRLLLEELQRWFGRTRSEAIGIVDELHLEGLVENMDAERRPSSTGNNCRVRATPRACRLWQHLETESVLLQCFRDDCCLRSDLNERTSARPVAWIMRPTYDLNFQMQLNQCFLMCLQSFVVEREQLSESIKDPNSLEEFVRLYSDETITQVLIRGVRNSWERFFRVELSSSESTYEPIEQLNERVSEWWRDFCAKIKAGGT